METDQLGWTEAQWNRVREEVFNAWQRVRVAGSFLPPVRLAPGRAPKIVPSEVFRQNGSIDDHATAYLLEISLPVTLTRQEVRDETLPARCSLCSRAGRCQVGQLEDWYIFNGIVAGAAFPSTPRRANYARTSPSPRAGSSRAFPLRSWTRRMQIEGLRRWNPGALGLFYSPKARSRR